MNQGPSAVDLLDGTIADETMQFMVEGRSYEIDLSAENARRLREAFDPYILAGRQVTAFDRLLAS